MRNHITAETFDLSDASMEVRRTPRATRAERGQDRVRDHRSGCGDGRDDLSGRIVPPTADFEGFGSFSG